jgi:hypothetical protein
MTDYNVFMRRDRQPNMDLEASAVAMPRTWGDNFHPASGNTLIVRFQPRYFA